MLTKHLESMIKEMPTEGWFSADDLWTSKVPRKDWVLQRLIAEGILESKVEWKVDPDNLDTKTRTDFRTIRFFRLKKVEN